jgi:hypothetical protein
LANRLTTRRIIRWLNRINKQNQTLQSAK